MTAPPGRPARRAGVVMRCAKCGARITVVDPDLSGRTEITLLWATFFGGRAERWEGLDESVETGRYRCKCGKTHVIVLADAVAAARRAKRLGCDLRAGAPGFGVP